jgi:hypothetical protein
MEVMMARSYLATGGIVLSALLAFPTVSSASFMDFIYEMSGPQLVSVFPVHCEYDLLKHKSLCELYYWRFAGEANPESGFWLGFNSAGYFSTFKDSPTGEYGWFMSDMLTFEPMFWGRSSSRFYHGIGLSTDFFVGKEFSRFGAVALKVEPLNVRLPWRLHNWYAGPALRVYRHRRTAAQFDAPAPKSPNRTSRFERFVIGISLARRAPPRPVPVQATPN